MPLEEEALKGRLLDAWIEDLRNDRPPRIVPDMEQLTPEALEEVLRLARWSKATFYPSRVSPDTASSLVTSIKDKVYVQRQAEIRWVEQRMTPSARFSALIQEARLHFDLPARVLEERCSLPEGIVARLETEQLPPQRIAVDKMILLLRSLRFSGKIVDVIRRACMEWANLAYSQEQTQLARIDPTVSDATRVELLRDTAQDTREALEREKRRIQQYCEDLATGLR